MNSHRGPEFSTEFTGGSTNSDHSFEFLEEPRIKKPLVIVVFKQQGKMIGFEEEPISEKGHPREDADTKSLDKRAFYTMVNKTYFLPPFSSRGMNREYLLKVHRGQAFRVIALDLRHFEVELTTEMNKRVGLLNNCFLVRKVNVLLTSRSQPELGFDEYDPPEEAWLYRVVRYLDPTNILEFFEAPVTQEPSFVEGKSNTIQAVHHGRIIASKYFFRLEQIRKDRKMWEQLKALSTNYRAYLCQRMLVDKMEHDLRICHQKSEELLRQLEDQISKISFTYSIVETPTIRSEMIIHSSKDLTKEMRDTIQFNCQL